MDSEYYFQNRKVQDLWLQRPQGPHSYVTTSLCPPMTGYPLHRKTEFIYLERLPEIPHTLNSGLFDTQSTLFLHTWRVSRCLFAFPVATTHRLNSNWWYTVLNAFGFSPIRLRDVVVLALQDGWAEDYRTPLSGRRSKVCLPDIPPPVEVPLGRSPVSVLRCLVVRTRPLY